jgi:ATP-dependent Clp protease, protease subunit
MNEFYKFVCAADDSDNAELLIFGPIGDWEDMGDVSAKGFAKALAALPAAVKRLDIHINSPGGSLFEANAIYSRLADHRSTKNVYIDGIAASAATIIAMVGHKIFIRANATMMIHMPSGVVMGNADDMRQLASALDTVTESMLNVYEKRTGKARNDIRAMLSAETWMSPDQAVEHGFADEVRGVVKAAASLGSNQYNFNGQVFDLSRFSHIPAFNATREDHMDTPPVNGGASGAADPTPPPPTTPPPTTTPPPPTTTPPPPSQPEARSYDDGIAAERARVTALQKLDRPETHAVVTAAIKDGKTASDIFEDVMAAMDKAKTRGARRDDAAALDHIPPADAAGEDVNDFGTLLKQKVQARAKMRTRPMRVHSRN